MPPPIYYYYYYYYLFSVSLTNRDLSTSTISIPIIDLFTKADTIKS